MSIFDNLKARNNSRTSKTNSYYTPRTAEYVAAIVGEWAKTGFAPQRISAGALQLGTNSLWSKLRYGLQYLSDLDHGDPEINKFYKELYGTVEIQQRGDYVILTRRRSAAGLLEPVPDYDAQRRLGGIERLRDWLKTAQDGMSWEFPREAGQGRHSIATITAFKTEFEIADAAVPDTFMWSATYDKIKIVRMPREKLMAPVILQNVTPNPLDT